MKNSFSRKKGSCFHKYNTRSKTRHIRHRNRSGSFIKTHRHPGLNSLIFWFSSVWFQGLIDFVICYLRTRRVTHTGCTRVALQVTPCARGKRRDVAKVPAPVLSQFPFCLTEGQPLNSVCWKWDSVKKTSIQVVLFVGRSLYQSAFKNVLDYHFVAVGRKSPTSWSR